MELKPGNKIFGAEENEIYEIFRLIGSGSFSIVYEIRDEEKRRFALKTVNTAILRSRKLMVFLNEGKIAAEINDDNVIRIFFFHDGNRYPKLPPYLIMEYADGGTLQDIINSQKSYGRFFKTSRLNNIFLQLARGMKAVNENLVHRDIAPANVLIKDGILKISDFGFSRSSAPLLGSKPLRGIQNIKYAAPETWREECNSLAMDMYSMGIIFYEMATLQYPYREPRVNNPEKWRECHIFHPPIDPQKFNPDLETSLAQLILKMIAKRPKERYESWDEVIRRLKV